MHFPMHLLAVAKITWLDVFIVSMFIKIIFVVFIVWMIRLVRHEDRLARPTLPTLATTVAPRKRVAVIYCPFCESEQTASVRMEQVDGEAMYELVCWRCHAALPETTLVAMVEPHEWLSRSEKG